MTAKNRGLGRGLDALFSQTESVLEAADVKKSQDGEYIIEIPISLIDVNKDQPRKTFNEQSIAELASSIDANGLLQPIALAKNGERYTIIAGERRYRAFRYLNKDKIPAIIKNLTKQQSMELALVENIQRSDLNPIEEALAIDSLMKEFGYTQQELSQRLGMSRSALANSVRLLTLPQEIKKMVMEGVLSNGHARALISLDDAKKLTVSKIVTEKGLNVRQTEELVKRLQSDKKQPKPKKTYTELNDAENYLRQYLGTKVSIAGSPKKGKLIIEYYSQDELEGILDIFAEK